MRTILAALMALFATSGLAEGQPPAAASAMDRLVNETDSVCPKMIRDMTSRSDISISFKDRSIDVVAVCRCTLSGVVADSRFVSHMERNPAGLAAESSAARSYARMRILSSALSCLAQDMGKSLAAFKFDAAENAYQEGEAGRLLITDLTVRAEAGDVEAQDKLGIWYGMGLFVPQNYNEALRWLSRAAAQGHANSQLMLGFMYMLGQGTDKNEPQGVSWFRKAAEQGYAAAQYSLGSAYQRGNGVEKDIGEAIKWYRRAADSGDRQASEALKKLLK